MEFISTWFTAYISPNRFIEKLRGKPAPWWGFYGQLLRGLMDALLLFLPVYLMGRTPPTGSYITLFPTQNYYATLIWLAPLVFFLQWLACCAIVHVILRLVNHPSDMDFLLNLGGMMALVVGFLLIIWDWFWIAAGGLNQYALGISHLVIDLYGVVIGILAMKRILGVPIWLGITTQVFSFLIALPLAALFIRSPL